MHVRAPLLALVAALMLAVPAGAAVGSPTFSHSPALGDQSVQLKRDLSPGANNTVFRAGGDPFSPRAHAAAGPAVAVGKFVLEAVLSGIAYEGFGWLLETSGAGPLGPIDAKLEEINGKLADLQTQVDKIYKLGVQADCNGANRHLDTLRADTDTAWNQYNRLSNPNLQDRAGEKAELLRRLDKLEPEARAREIHNALANPSPTQETLLQVCGHAIQEKAKPFLTPHSSAQIREMLEYWQAYEAKLVTLRVEQIHANFEKPYKNATPCKEPYNTRDYPDRALDEACRGRHNLATENGKLKPEIKPGTFVYIKWIAGSGFPGSEGGYPYSLWSGPAFGSNRHDAGHNAFLGLLRPWRIATADQLFDLLNDCCRVNEGDVTATEWLHERAGVNWGHIPPANSPAWNGIKGHCNYRHEVPLVWALNDANDAQNHNRCDFPESPKPYHGYDVAIPLGKHGPPREWRDWCGTYCGFPSQFPGVAFTVRKADPQHYLYK